MTFSIDYDAQPLDFLKKCDKHISRRIIDKIEKLLSYNSVPHTAKSIVGERGVFRIRVGGYRALYRINYSDKKIIIFFIEKRSKVYD